MGILAESGCLEQRCLEQERDDLFQRCPKCGHAPDPADAAARASCPACGLIYAKYLAARNDSEKKIAVPSAEERSAPLEERPAAFDRLLEVPAGAGGIGFYARVAAYAFFLAWGWRLYACDIATAEINGSFMHNIILPIHEAGHVLFLFLGRFMAVAGGSILQVLLPLVLALAFVFGKGGCRRDNFAASLMLWWVSVAIIDLAPYIWDAFDPKLVLLDGRTDAESDGHDWQNILGDLGLIRRAHLIGAIAHQFGLVVMLAADAWGALLLYLQFQRRGATPDEDG